MLPEHLVMTAISARPVVLLIAADSTDPHGHDHLTRVAMAERIAALHGGRYAGVFDNRETYGAQPYFIPDCTLLVDEAAAFGIRGEDDLFGGVVPHAFLANKTISHPLAGAGAAAPDGWSPRLAQRLGDAVLPGFSAFSREDAKSAGERLLAGGRVRVKLASGVGGGDQAVVDAIEALEAALAGIDDDELRRHGVVIERDLGDALTYSVGRLRVAGMPYAYYGTQSMVEDRDGAAVYGGSELTVTRGGFQDLLRLPLIDEVHRAVRKAVDYDAAVSAEFPAFFASRRNYDIACGQDSRGAPHCGVLEQSWRIGGATPAEIAAIEALREDPALASVAASTHEVHRPQPAPPGARVHFHDPRSESGPILKYSLVRRHGHPA